ncbi:MAG: SGNH/GDSL hydrolase family protein [Ruminococcus sp.]|nr:SGNH/GDSL hydrolase family protein [Ruminococcus sp.]
MKKLLALTLAMCMAGAAFTGCGDSGSSSETASSGAEPAAASQGGEESSSQAAASSDLAAPVNDGPLDITQGMTENMLTRSVHLKGDTSRLAQKLKEAKDPNNDKAWNIVFLGDSITAGSTTSKGDNSFVNRFAVWWKDNYNRKSIITNAGIGATNSYYGVHRLERDVFEYTPDIIFVEFINDTGNPFFEATMESLIRSCLAYETNPAVVLVEMSLDGGGNAQDIHSTSAEKYGVPVLSYHDAVYPEVQAGNISFKSSSAKANATDGLSPDGTHPNDYGHLMVAQMIESFIDKVYAEADSAGEVTPFDTSSESITGDIYKDATIVDLSTEGYEITEQSGFEGPSSPWNFQNGWSAQSSGESITFEMEFRNLGMLYLKTVNGNTGKVSVSVDGQEVSTVDGDFPGGWGDYGTDTEIYRSDEKAKHKVTVTVLDGDKQNFEILGWLVS